MEYYDRTLMEKLKKWVDRKEIYAIRGPRQCGKTTLLHIFRDWLIQEKGVEPDHIIFVTFEDREILEKFQEGPKELIQSYMADDERYYFLLDEFQYVEGGGKKLKFLYDTLEEVKFLITGSSSLELASKTSQYLVGRMFSFKLFPFSLQEFINVRSERLKRIYQKKNRALMNFLQHGKDFKVEEDIFVSDLNELLHEFVRYGGYPEVVKAEDLETKEIILKNIYHTYVTRDIIELLEIHEVSKLRKLVTLLSSQLGGMVNYNELSNSCDTYYKKIKEFLHVLRETYILEMIKPYHKNLKTELKKNPKVYFVDLGMRNYAIENFTSLEKRGDTGEIVENFVLNQLQKKEMGTIHYWRTQGKAEVDFVLAREKETIPVEVKYKKFEEEKVSRAFRSYISAYHPNRALIVTKNFWGDLQIEDTKVKFVPVCYL